MLDVRTGRYSALAPAAGDALRRSWELGAVAVADRGHLRQLLAAGTIVSATAEALPLFGGLRPPEDHLRVNRAARVPAGDLLAALIAQMVARAGLRLFGFHIFHRLFSRCAPRMPGSTSCTEEQAIARLVAALERSELLLPRNDRCLSRTIALRLLGLCRGIPLRLVVGVRDGPFAAHCWAEQNGLVLNDDLHVVAGYTPLLTV
jgi:hypothetical protein